MAAFDFPSSPSVGTIYTANDVSWYWDGTLWNRRPSSWTRPSEWPALPDVSVGEQKLVALVQVSDTSSEHIAILCAGNYTVNWGDGNTENVSANTKAQHTYTYANISGSALSYGYKTVTVTITPQSGQNLTKVDFQQKNSNIGASVINWSPRWLDVLLNAPNCTQLVVGGSTCITHLNMLQQFTLRQHALTSMVSLFENIYNVKCVNLNTSGVTNLENTFYNCVCLEEVYLSDTSSVTNMIYLFCYCYCLRNISAMNTAAVTNMYGMFAGCFSLTAIPAMNTAAVTNMYGMFTGCYSLTVIPAMNTAAVTNMSGMFSGCYSLTAIPAMNTAAVTNMFEMFYGCYSLTAIPAMNTAAVTNMDGMFSGCFSLTAIPALNFGGVTTSEPGFSECGSLTRILVTGLRYGFSVSNLDLSTSALNEIFTNLGTAVGEQTINITNCTGAETCTKTIATNKGWTVTG